MTGIEKLISRILEVADDGTFDEKSLAYALLPSKNIKELTKNEIEINVRITTVEKAFNRLTDEISKSEENLALANKILGNYQRILRLITPVNPISSMPDHSKERIIASFESITAAYAKLISIYSTLYSKTQPNNPAMMTEKRVTFLDLNHAFQRFIYLKNNITDLHSNTSEKVKEKLLYTMDITSLARNLTSIYLNELLLYYNEYTQADPRHKKEMHCFYQHWSNTLDVITSLPKGLDKKVVDTQFAHGLLRVYTYCERETTDQLACFNTLYDLSERIQSTSHEFYLLSAIKYSITTLELPLSSQIQTQLKHQFIAINAKDDASQAREELSKNYSFLCASYNKMVADDLLDTSDTSFATVDLRALIQAISSPKPLTKETNKQTMSIVIQNNLSSYYEVVTTDEFIVGGSTKDLEENPDDFLRKWKMLRNMACSDDSSSLDRTSSSSTETPIELEAPKEGEHTPYYQKNDAIREFTNCPPTLAASDLDLPDGKVSIIFGGKVNAPCTKKRRIVGQTELEL